MNVPHLSVVRVEEDSAAARAQRLFAEARAAAAEQVAELERALETVVALAESVAQGGDIYPAGVRDLSRRMAEDADARRQTLNALAARRSDDR